MALTADQITAQNFKSFYEQIRPYLNGQVPTFANQFSRSDLYSTSEKIIGQWIDGKPLYQKTVDCGTAPTGIDDRKYINSGLTNEKVLNIYGIAYRSSDNKSMPIPYVVAGTTLDNFKHQIAVAYYGGTHQIEVGAGADKSDYNVYVTLQYTKSTDSAIKVGTGTDYSTDEQIIGSWIDGKPLYQKTFVNVPFVQQTDTQINKAIAVLFNPSESSVLNLVGYEDLLLDNGQNNKLSLGSMLTGTTDYSDNEVFQAWLVCQNTLGIVISTIRNNGQSAIGRTATVTIRYTKTTD